MENSPLPAPTAVDCTVQSPPPVAEPAEPHGALFLVLGYLRLPELFSFHRVCRSFRDAIGNDVLLWRDVKVEPPLSGKLTDDALWDVASKAEGKLRSLALLDCSRVTDVGLLRVADANPFITKLCLPGCIHVTVDGVVRLVGCLTERTNNLKQLRLHRTCNVTKDHLDILKALICKNCPQQGVQKLFYSQWRSQLYDDNDDRPIDIEICPKCNNSRLVFDCTREDCRLMIDRWNECRGCFFCIPRCEECGACVHFEEFGEETSCSHLLCLDCWLHLPKCNMCNRPYCKWHMTLLYGSSRSSADGFVCELCLDREAFFRFYD